MKTIIPIKLVIANDGKGNITSAIFLYKISVNGHASNNVYTIDVNGVLANVSYSNLFATAVAQATKSEGAS